VRIQPVSVTRDLHSLFLAGAFFTTYEGIKAILEKRNPTLSGSNAPLVPQPLIHATASSIAELVSCAILTPAEVIKQNAQMVDASKRGPNATLQTLAKFRKNPLALWRGYTALAGRNLPFTALQFPMFEHFKRMLRDWRDRTGKRTGTLLESGCITAASAGTAGSIAAVVTTPIDVVKTRIMLAAADGTAKEPGPNMSDTVQKIKDGKVKDAMGHVTKSKGRQSSMMIAREIIADKGWVGLFRGGALRAVWTMIGSGLYLGVYESGRIYLARRRGKDIDEDELL